MSSTTPEGNRKEQRPFAGRVETGSVFDLVVRLIPCGETLHIGLDLPVPAAGRPFALQGWLVGTPRIERVEVRCEGRVIAKAELAYRRPDVVLHFPDCSDDRIGFFCYLDPFLLPQRFELQGYAVPFEGGEVPRLFCSVNGSRPVLPTTEPNPLLITGLGRCGTTMLIGVLAMHPDVVAHKPFKQEPRFASYWKQVFKTLSSGCSREAPLACPSTGITQDGLLGRELTTPQELLHYGFYPEQWDDFYQRFCPELLAFCTAQLRYFYAHAARLQGKAAPRWMAEKFVPGADAFEVKRLFPAAREIVLVRDPRDVFCSVLAFMRKRGYIGFGREWFDNDLDYLERAFIPGFAELHEYAQGNHHACLVRYEDVVRFPLMTFQRIYHYLGIDDSEECIRGMLDRVRGAAPEDQAAHRTAASDSASIGRYRGELAADAVAIIEDSLAEALLAWSYGASSSRSTE